MNRHRAGGKLTTNHTTVIDVVGELVDFLQNLAPVTKISIGVVTILTGTRSSSTWVVKLQKESDGCVHAKALQKISTQEFWFYTDGAADTQEAMLATARFVRNNGWELRFK